MRKAGFLLCFLLLACQQANRTVLLVSPEGETVPVQVEVADDEAERAQGLMSRTELPAGHGMLFLYPQEQTLSFWMKNTLIPLDILFFDRDGNFVSSATMQPCVQEPCESYLSAAPARDALEVPAGFLQPYGVGEGWRLGNREEGLEY
jgi:hypothetical protein